ncbi:unnamed protein product, partial [Iphiclides podalirius]
MKRASGTARVSERLEVPEWFVIGSECSAAGHYWRSGGGHGAAGGARHYQQWPAARSLANSFYLFLMRGAQVGFNETEGFPRGRGAVAASLSRARAARGRPARGARRRQLSPRPGPRVVEPHTRAINEPRP